MCDAEHPSKGDFPLESTVSVGDFLRKLRRMRTYLRTVLPPAQRAAVLDRLAQRSIGEIARLNPAQAEHLVEDTIEQLHARSDSESMPAKTVTCATRASALAMTQTRHVAARLAARGIPTTLLTITSTGDRIQDRPISELGSVNVWVKELEVALADGRAQYAVHSCKDMPGQLTDGMEIAAISEREDPRDAFCSERYARFEDLPAGATVGTSSPRRRAQLAALRPDLRYEDLRGNVDTRLRKLREGSYDAIVLAMAGLRRLGVAATHTVAFEPDAIVPAVGQGALAIEVLAGGGELTRELFAAIDHAPTHLCVQAERAALRALRAGCSAPLGVHARLHAGVMTIDAAFGTSDGRMLRERLTGEVRDVAGAQALGERLAARLAETTQA